MKLNITLDQGGALESKFVPPAGHVYVFVPPFDFKTFGTNTIGMIPHQERGSTMMSRESKILYDSRVTGYDWRGEALNSVKANGLTIYASTSHQYPDQVEAFLKEKGLVCTHIEISKEDFRALSTHEDSTYDAPKAEERTQDQTLVELHGRARYLWKNFSKKLSPWEADFVKNVGTRINAGKYPSPPQIAHLDKLFTKYAIPMDATASEHMPSGVLPSVPRVKVYKKVNSYGKSKL